MSSITKNLYKKYFLRFSSIFRYKGCVFFFFKNIKKLKISIKKKQKKFELDCSYHPKVIKMIKKMPNRYYSKVQKRWNLPLEEYEMFFNEISKEPEFNIEISECKPIVSLKIINDSSKARLIASLLGPLFCALFNTVESDWL